MQCLPKWQRLDRMSSRPRRPPPSPDLPLSAIYNSKADKWRESGPLISVNWMWRHFFTTVRYGTLPEDIRGGCWIGIFNVLITGRVDDSRSCSASTALRTQAGGRCERGAKEPLCSSDEETNTHAAPPHVREAGSGVKTVAFRIPDRLGGMNTTARINWFDWQACSGGKSIHIVCKSLDAWSEGSVGNVRK